MSFLCTRTVVPELPVGVQGGLSEEWDGLVACLVQLVSVVGPLHGEERASGVHEVEVGWGGASPPPRVCKNHSSAANQCESRAKSTIGRENRGCFGRAGEREEEGCGAGKWRLLLLLLRKRWLRCGGGRGPPALKQAWPSAPPASSARSLGLSDAPSPSPIPPSSSLQSGVASHRQ